MLLKNYIKEYKTNRAFSIAEMLLVLLIISFLILAMPPIIHKKYVKRIIRGQHGRYECFRDINGNLYEYIATEKDGMITGHSAGTKDAPLGVNPGTTCSFNSKDYAGNAAYFMFQAVGGGAGGSYPLFEYNSNYYGETATYAEADVYLQNDVDEPGYSAAKDIVPDEHTHQRQSWIWSYNKFVNKGLLDADSNYYVANMEWVNDFFPPVYNINKVELCSPQGSLGMPKPEYFSPNDAKQAKTEPAFGQFPGPGYCIYADKNTLMLPLQYVAEDSSKKYGSFSYSTTSYVDFVIPVVEEYRLIDVTSEGTCESTSCSRGETHAMWSDGCATNGDDIKCKGDTRTLTERYYLGTTGGKTPWLFTNKLGYVNEGYTNTFGETPFYREKYLKLLTHDGTVGSEINFPRVRFFAACDDENPKCADRALYVYEAGITDTQVIANEANGFLEGSPYNRRYEGMHTSYSAKVYSDLHIGQYFIPLSSSSYKFVVAPGSFNLKHGKDGEPRIDSEYLSQVTDKPVLPDVATDSTVADKFSEAVASGKFTAGTSYSDPDPNNADVNTTYYLPAPFKLNKTSSTIVKDPAQHNNHNYIHYGRRVVPKQSYLWNDELITKANSATVSYAASGSGYTPNWSNTDAIFPPKIHMKWETSYNTPTMAYAGKPGEVITMMLPKIEKPMRFDIKYGAGANGDAGSYSISNDETGVKTRTGKNGGNTVVEECSSGIVTAAGACSGGSWNTIMTAKGGVGTRGTIKAAKVFLRGAKTCYPSNDNDPAHVRDKVDGCLDGGFADKNSRFSTESGFYIVDELDADSPTPSALSYYYNVTLHTAHPELIAAITPGTGGFGGYTYVTSTESKERRSARGHNNFTYSSLAALHADDPNYMNEWDATTGYIEAIGNYVSRSVDNSLDFINHPYYCTVQRGSENDKLETDALNDANTYHEPYPKTSPTQPNVGLCKPAKGTPGAVVILW